MTDVIGKFGLIFFIIVIQDIEAYSLVFRGIVTLALSWWIFSDLFNNGVKRSKSAPRSKE